MIRLSNCSFVFKLSCGSTIAGVGDGGSMGDSKSVCTAAGMWRVVVDVECGSDSGSGGCGSEGVRFTVSACLRSILV